MESTLNQEVKGYALGSHRSHLCLGLLEMYPDFKKILKGDGRRRLMKLNPEKNVFKEQKGNCLFKEELEGKALKCARCKLTPYSLHSLILWHAEDIRVFVTVLLLWNRM